MPESVTVDLTADAPGPATSAAASVSAAAPARPSASLIAVGTAIPPTRLSSAQMAAELGVAEEWILSRMGIVERPRAAAGETLNDYAVAAGRAALERAGIAGADVDLVIVATTTPDEITPATAPIVARRLEAVGAGTFDVNAACTGFLTGVSLAASQIESGRARTVLLIGADFISRIVNHGDHRSAPLFADAAGAAVLVAGPPAPVVPGGGAPAPAWSGGWVGPVVLGADGDPGRALYAGQHDRQVVMDGPEVFRVAVTRMAEASRAALAATGRRLEDIDLIVPHQANARITRALTERLGADPAKVVDCIATMGNASAATLPIGLDVAAHDGRLVPGATVLLTAFGAGFSWGAGVLHWDAAVPVPSDSRPSPLDPAARG